VQFFIIKKHVEKIFVPNSIVLNYTQ